MNVFNLGDSPIYRDSLSQFGCNTLQNRNNFLLPKEIRDTRFPTRLLRYWFMLRYIDKYTNTDASLSVCEIGSDRGQMHAFLQADTTHQDASAKKENISARIETWDAIDVTFDQAWLRSLGYCDLFQCDIEADESWGNEGKAYDIVIMLHILEHLDDPERAFHKALKIVKPGGIIMGGYPVIPQFLVKTREAQLRRSAREFGHVSAFSPARTLELGKTNNLQLRDISGAYMMRKKGFILENHQLWIRFNLAFGNIFKSWPGELYWCFSKKRGELTI